jgi:hypothetical protein
VAAVSGPADSLALNPRDPDNFLTLYNDPGEDYGWAIGHDLNLVARGTHKMWTFLDFVWEKLQDPATDNWENPLANDEFVRNGQDPAVMQLPIKRIVCEDFRIYPWKAKELAWDPVRTARAIGALTFMARLHSIPLRFQGANIKAAAQAAGAEELYDRPLRENRHQNDAIQHFVFFTNTELLGLNLPIPDSVGPEAYGE